MHLVFVTLYIMSNLFGHGVILLKAFKRAHLLTFFFAHPELVRCIMFFKFGKCDLFSNLQPFAMNYPCCLHSCYASAVCQIQAEKDRK